MHKGKHSSISYSQSLKENSGTHAFDTQFVIFLGKKGCRYPQAHKSYSENSEYVIKRGAS